MLIQDVLRFELVELFGIDHVAFVFVEEYITSHHLWTEFTFKFVFWTI